MAQLDRQEIQASNLEDDLLRLIKKDDVKAFDLMMDKTQCGAYRLGRFPVLSLLYLYKSKKILAAYEETFLKLTNYVALNEPFEISRKFATKAKKSLRLYYNEVVSPLEMLLILDKTRRLKRVYPKVTPSSAVKGRLKSIYYIKYSLNVRFEGNEIFIDRRPLTYLEKKRIVTVSVSVVLAFVIFVGAPSAALAIFPNPLKGDVTKLSQIKFNSTKRYTLNQDIILPENYTIDKVNCSIAGNGKKIILSKGASLGELNGKLSNVTIESAGDAIFTSVNQNASIKNVKINVNADVKSSQTSAFVAINNYGTIEDVILNVKGKINAIATTLPATEELTFGAIAQNNGSKYDSATQTVYGGTIKNCTVNYDEFKLIGEASANAAFGGVVGINASYLQDCVVSGKIIADTFDVAGICSVNNGALSRSVNETEIIQTSASDGWNPIASGIALTNANSIEYCKNNGKILATSNCEMPDNDEKVPTVSAAGIAYNNSGIIAYCVNSASITATGKGEAYVGGIASHAFSQISHCLSSGSITVQADTVYSGGILGCSEVSIRQVSLGYYSIAFGVVDNCISESKINASADEKAFIGGITGYIKESGIEQSGGAETIYFGGAVTNSYFTGELVQTGGYVGNIAGVVGANIYESNTYSSNGVTYYNFEKNFYLGNSLNAFGARISADENYLTADDKGAASATIEVIKSSQSYKDILNSLN